MIPWARTRSWPGSQRENTLARLGKQPASPTPNRKRKVSSDQKFQAQPVRIVNADHIVTTRMRTARGPIRSPSQPPGISKLA